MHAGKPSPDNGSPEVPELTQKVFTTGRGGRGNMAHTEDPEVARKFQDCDSPSLAPVASPTIGRGGYGNVRAGQEASQSLFSKARNMFKKKDSRSSDA